MIFVIDFEMGFLYLLRNKVFDNFLSFINEYTKTDSIILVIFVFNNRR